jgi:hypothetical protein
MVRYIRTLYLRQCLILRQVAEIDIRLGTPPGPPRSKAESRGRQFTDVPITSVPSQFDTDCDAMTALAATTAGRTNVNVTGVYRSRESGQSPETVTLHNVKVNATLKQAGK